MKLKPIMFFGNYKKQMVSADAKTMVIAPTDEAAAEKIKAMVQFENKVTLSEAMQLYHNKIYEIANSKPLGATTDFVNEFTLLDYITSLNLCISLTDNDFEYHYKDFN